MGPSETRTFWISVASGLFAAFLLYSYSQEKQAEVNKKFGSSSRVVVAKTDIAEMQTVDDTMLDLVDIPKDFVQPSAVTEPDLAVGQVAAAPIKKGEQILQTKLLTPGPDTGIALQVAPRKRALTLPIDEIRGVAKLLKPGDRVDVIAAVDIGRGSSARREIQVLMQNVPVLATGVNVLNNLPRIFEVNPTNKKDIVQTTLTGDTSYSTITLEVTPKESLDLIYMMSTSPGNLYMTLRNPNDILIERLPSSTVETVVGKPTDVSEFRKPVEAPRIVPPQVSQPVVAAPQVPLKPATKQPSRPARKTQSGPFRDL